MYRVSTALATQQRCMHHRENVSPNIALAHCTKTILKASLKSLTIKVPRLLWRKSPVYFVKAPRAGRKSPRKSF
jgi:hypothetical protein